MKKFRFQYPTIVWVLTSIILVMCTLGFCWNVFNLIELSWSNTVKIFSYVAIATITFGLTVFSISLLVYGKYVIKNGFLYTFFGFIRTKINISDIVGITLFKKTNKLVIYLKEQSYSVIVISPDKYDAFTLALLEQNKQILYDTKIDGEE